MTRLNAAVLIVSDTAFAEPSTDRTISTLKPLLRTAPWQLALHAIVPDDVGMIQAKILDWCAIGWQEGEEQDRINLILTSGGTGFAVRDYTPEAVDVLLDRKAPGLVHAMLTEGGKVTPFAMMARPVAGTHGHSVIVTLPGSPKGAKESLEAVIKLLPHACLQAAGGNTREMHEGGTDRLEKQAQVGKFSHGDGSHSPALSSAGSGYAHTHAHTHSHAHSHNSSHGHQMPVRYTQPDSEYKANDHTLGAAARHRVSPYPTIPVEEALQRVLAKTPLSKVIEMPLSPDLRGYVLAENVYAIDPVPAFRASIVDGYALIVDEEKTDSTPSTKGVFQVSAISHANKGGIDPIPTGTIARITTGAPLPPNANAVIMVEDTKLHRANASGDEELEVEIMTDQVKAGDNIREVGSDITRDQLVLRKGEAITGVGGEIGLLASVGKSMVKVYAKPVVGVLSTGNEIVPFDKGTLDFGEVRNSNSVTLRSILAGWGYLTRDLGTAEDTAGDLENRLRAAFREVEVIITTGGVSMGELDLLKPTIERSLGGAIHFGRVAMKPGKPTTFATVPFKANDGTNSEVLIFSLPGNPASAACTTSLFVKPCLAKMSGNEISSNSSRVRVTLEDNIRPDKSREEYQRATVVQGQDGQLYASTTGGQRSSRIGSFKGANAFLIVPPGAETIEKGANLQALLIDGLA